MYLGIEIGGTKLQAAVGEDGQIEKIVRRTVDAQRDAEGIREQLSEIVPALCSEFPIRGVGVGFGGPVDAANGIVTTSHQVAGWDDFPLSKWLTELSGANCQLLNDCDSAALAEAHFGAGKEAGRVLYLTVGTGVGGGFVIDGVVQGTDRPAATEIGHLRPGLDCSDPHATVESISSGRGIENGMRRLMDEQQDDVELLELNLSKMEDDETLSAKEICALAGEGNPLALQVLDRACRTLGWGIAQAITLMAPEVVVIGGGVSLSGEKLFLGPVRKATADFVFPGLAESYELVPAALGEEVVLYGALSLAASGSGTGNSC
ncbi:MAG: ROK family protein [Planctomycetaceae bacterium]|nr:ROK family protein [Planctomycetaceae bacterium]